MSLLARLLIGGIHLYRRTLGALMPPTCRFEPTCSRYAEGCLREHGALKGAMLTCWRLLRCNPLGEYGHDPVPPQDQWRSALARRVVARTNKALHWPADPLSDPPPGSQQPTTGVADLRS